MTAHSVEVYKDLIISTIVDHKMELGKAAKVYKDLIISTIVDGKQNGPVDSLGL